MLLQVYPIDPKARAKMVGVVNKVNIFSDMYSQRSRKTCSP